ncbi:MAG: endonuclease/exonuclease/phosphatase family protein, partial [Octadecabacter sp.]|nr:endonuclease/exonuclease/phosphatase family protein [Octadecabacter sp.]
AEGKHDTPARRVQAQAACVLLSQITQPTEDVVLAGDFNVLPDSETLQILSDWGLRDLVGDRDTRTTLYPKPVRHANYMLVSASVQVAAFDAPASPVVSDHRPLVLDL